MEEKLLELLSVRRGPFRPGIRPPRQSVARPRLAVSATAPGCCRSSATWRGGLAGHWCRGRRRAAGRRRVRGRDGCGRAWTSGSPSPSAGSGAERRRPTAIPDAFHDHLRGKNVAIVDDAINAGSATRRDLRRADGAGRAARGRRRPAHPGRHGVTLLRREQTCSRERRPSCQRAVGTGRLPACAAGCRSVARGLRLKAAAFSSAAAAAAWSPRRRRGR